MHQLEDYFNFHRVLVAGSVSQATIQDQASRWKSSFWEHDVVDAAILRAPVVLIFFLYLWSANVFILDRINLQYYAVLGIKSGMIVLRCYLLCLIVLLGPFTHSLFSAISLTLLYAVTVVASKELFEFSTETSVIIFYILMIIWAFSWFPGLENRYGL